MLLGVAHYLLTTLLFSAGILRARRSMVTTHFSLLYFMRVATVRPEKQQSIKVGFNVSKLGFASVTEDTLAALAH